VTTTFPPPALTATPTLAPITIPTSTSEVVKFSPETWATMVANGENLKALEALPATMTIDGVEMNKGSFSTVDGQNHLVIYFDTNGDYAGSQNLLTGKFEKTGTGAIEVFRTEDGGYYEMRAFGFEGMNEEQQRKMVADVLYDAIVVDGVAYGLAGNSWPDIVEQAHALDSIEGFAVNPDFINMIKVPNSTERMGITGQNFAGSTICQYPSEDKVLVWQFLRGIDAETLRKILTDMENPVIPARPN
jgi:hypothetical protein